MSEFNFSEPSETIQVELTDGRIIEGPRGKTVGEFLEVLRPELGPDLLAAVVNGEMQELTYVLDRPAVIRPVTIKDADGFIIFKRTLVFLLAACFEKLFPEYDLEVKHSVSGGGTLCNVTGPETFTQQDRNKLESAMRKMVKQNLPIKSYEMPIDEAREMFRKRGQTDKIEMLRYYKKDSLRIYELGEFRDYFYGHMARSTGSLKYFKLETASGKNQFLLRHPAGKSSTKIESLVRYKRMRPIFEEHHDWQKNLNISMLSAINRAIDENRIEDVILVSEALQNRQFMKAGDEIAKRKGQIKAVMIAGPSSSGKTTSSKRLSVELLAHGISPIPIEMDNFFLEREKTPKDENGEYDFESVYAMDIPLFEDCMGRLMAGEEVQIPRFDFVLGKGVPGQVLQLKENQILIIEGIHGLNPIMQEHLPKDSIYRIFISPMTQVNMDRYNRVSVLDVRLIRRIVRDFRDRGLSAQDTLARWPSVRAGEDKNILPYQNQADIFINTSLVYEVSAMKDLAEIALRMVPFGVPEYTEAQRLLSFLEWVKPLDRSLVPANSILSEFIGGSNLKDFMTWRA